MKRFLDRNIGIKGRLVRGLMGLSLIVGAGFTLGHSAWLAGVLGAAGLFALFEAFRGWCLARACGVKTRF